MFVVGFDIGGTKSAVLIADVHDSKIDFLSRIQIKTENSWQWVLNELCAIYQRECKLLKIDTKDVVACGVSCGGPLDSEKGIICSPPNLPEWKEVHIVKYLEEKLSIPVKLMNDADACAVAEWKYGAGIGKKNIIFLTFGTGLGAGLILNGALYTGTNNLAGEVGHIRLEKDGPFGHNKKGSFEGFCSGAGIKQIAQNFALKNLSKGISVSFCDDLNNLDRITAKDVIQCAEHGAEDAILLLKETGKYFGRGLAILVDVLNPEMIIAGSIFTRAYKFLYEATLEVLKQEALTDSMNVCQLVPSKLGEKIGDYATIVSALRY